MNFCFVGRSREDSKDEHMHLSDAVIESVMVFRLGAGAVAEVVVHILNEIWVFTLIIYMKGPKQKGIISLEIVAYWFCMTRLFILYSYLAMRLRDCVQH